jgi:large subunit ribosomal protein L24
MATKRFAPKRHIKSGDQVMVITGEDKGKTGTVLRIFPADNKAVVEGVRMVTKHRKPAQDTPGSIDKMEARINISNLMLVDAAGVPSRMGRRLEGDKLVRYSKKTGQTIK